MERKALTVSQLNTYVKDVLGRDPLLRSIHVYGELSGFKRYPSGHLYFTLKDRDSQVRCVMFRSAAQTLRFQPTDGTQVVVLAEATIYMRDGQYQLYVQSMQPQGEGELYRQYLLLKARLEEKGYFDAAHKRSIPFLPRCVGVVTSGAGAALQDILQIIGRRFPAMHVQICPVKVQGEGAGREIAAAIRKLNKSGQASVLIVGRGGGSMEDLWAFNEERVALAIYESRIPVISAVGHETDFTIADFVADLRAPTPSAAAELCVPEYAQLVQQVDTLLERLPHAAQRGLEKRKEHILLLLQGRGFAATEHALAAQRQHLYTLQRSAAAAMHAALVSRRHALERATASMQALSPAEQLVRGYAIVQDTAGRALRSVAQLQAGMQVELVMADGRAQATVGQIFNELNEIED